MTGQKGAGNGKREEKEGGLESNSAFKLLD